MIDLIFPTTVYSEILKEEIENNKLYVDHCYKVKQNIENKTVDWRCTTFSSCGSYNLKNDSLFFPLMEKFVFHASEYSKILGVSNPKLKITDFFFNIAGYKDNQEYHIHSNSHLSLVYYAKAPKDSGNIIFRSSEANTDMFPLPISKFNAYNFKTYSFAPVDSQIIIFRSNLLHMVEPNLSNEDRISFAVNFVVE